MAKRKTKRRSAPKARRAAPKRKNTARRHAPRRKPRTAKRRNLGSILALTAGNPAKGHKHMAARKRKRHNKARRHAGHSKRRNPGTTMRRHHRRRNPGGMSSFGGPKTWLFGGIGVIVGSLGSRALPQAVMPSSNTGPMGYFLNAAATGILAVISHMVFKGNAALTGGIVAGGSGSLISRIIGDYSLLGSYSAQVAGAAGLGDYQFSDFLTPQRLTDGLNNRQLAIPSWGQQAMVPVSGNSAAAAGGVGSLYGKRLY